MESSHEPARAAVRHAPPPGSASARVHGCCALPVERRANDGPHARALAATAQRAAARPGGLPEGLRAGLERLSGRDLSGIRVHYGSPRPAQLEAHAYAQGRDIHLARGQERHLPHEAWHTVQQLQGRVRPTTSLRGTGINDDPRLEREATAMGARALRMGGGSPGARVAGGGGGAAGEGVIQGAWEYDPEEDAYASDAPVQKRLWEWRLRNGAEEYRYQDEDTELFTPWADAATYVEAGTLPPQGAMFAEQRRREAADEGVEMDSESQWKHAFVPSAPERGEPAEVVELQRRLRAGVAEIDRGTKDDKAMLDTLIAGEFREIEALAERVEADPGAHADLLAELFSPEEVATIVQGGSLGNARMEELKAGLRYKRVYEHEQNLLTVNRRSKKDYLRLVESLEADEELDVTREVEETDGGDIDRLYVTVRGRRWEVGTFYFEDTRFEELESRPRGATREVYRHRASGKEYVRDRYGNFVRRYVRRAIRYEDVLSLAEGDSMASKLAHDAPAGGKEATDYGDPALSGTELTHEQKVMGQIRGYSRFLSATTSGRLATSTSRSTYESPFGGVLLDLARMDEDRVTDTHTAEAMEEIFGIPDLGQVEFIPKHLPGESAAVKAARDGFRAREVVVDRPPQEAVLASRAERGTGLVVVGITGSATEEQIRAAVPRAFRDRIVFVEVNTRYKRTVDGHEGRTAFVFFSEGTKVEDAARAMSARVEYGADGVAEGAYVAPVPAGFVPTEAPDEVAIRSAVLGPSLATLRTASAAAGAIRVARLPRGAQRSIAVLRTRLADAILRLEGPGANRSMLAQAAAQADREAALTLGDLIELVEGLSKSQQKLIDLAPLRDAITRLGAHATRLERR